MDKKELNEELEALTKVAKAVQGLSPEAVGRIMLYVKEQTGAIEPPRTINPWWIQYWPPANNVPFLQEVKYFPDTFPNTCINNAAE